MSLTLARNYSPVSTTPVSDTFTVVESFTVSTTPAKNSSPVSLTPAMHAFAGVNDAGKACLCRCQWHRQCMHCRCRWHRWCTSTTFGSSPMPLKEQSVKKQAVSGYYFSIASIQSLKESSNCNKIVCFAGVNNTGEAPEYLKKIEIVTRLVYWGPEKLFEEIN